MSESVLVVGQMKVLRKLADVFQSITQPYFIITWRSITTAFEANSQERQWMWHHNLVGVSWLQQQSKLAKTCQQKYDYSWTLFMTDWSKPHDRESVTCSFAAPIKSRDPILLPLWTFSGCIPHDGNHRRPRDKQASRGSELDPILRWQLQQDQSELSCSQDIIHISNVHTWKCTRFRYSHDFRQRSIGFAIIHMMFHMISHRATNEEQTLDAHDEKSQGLTRVFQKSHDDDNKQSLGTSSVRFAHLITRRARVCAQVLCRRTCPEASS